MGIPHDTVVQLQQEGITGVADLKDFDKETIAQIATNLRRPGGRIQDPTAAAGVMIPTPPFVFGAKSQKRMTVATEMVKYYTTIRRPIGPMNMRWTHVGKNFEAQWKALNDKSKATAPKVPKITKTLPIIRWTEAFSDFLHRVIGIRKIPLAYVIRDEVAVEAINNCPRMADCPHSTKHGSIEDELIARASHGHPTYREDNQAVYYHLEEATRSTPYAASIKPFQRARNGRAAWLALSGQYAGVDKWEAEIKKHEQFLHTRKWKGQSNFTLERFIAQHRNAFVMMSAAAEHVAYQLPNEHSRVGLVLDNIECSDAGLQAAMASVRTDSAAAGGLRNNFELMAAHLLQYDPVQKKRAAQGDKRAAAEISNTTGEESANVSSFGTKKGIGKTGVHLRYHQAEEYKALSKAQAQELREWRESTGGGSKKKTKFNPKHKKAGKTENEKAFASAVQKEVAILRQADEDDRVKKDAAKEFIMSVISGMKGGQISDVSSIPPLPPPPKPSLNAITARAKNSPPATKQVSISG